MRKLYNIIHLTFHILFIKLHTQPCSYRMALTCNTKMLYIRRSSKLAGSSHRSQYIHVSWSGVPNGSAHCQINQGPCREGEISNTGHSQVWSSMQTLFDLASLRSGFEGSICYHASLSSPPSKNVWVCKQHVCPATIPHPAVCSWLIESIIVTNRGNKCDTDIVKAQSNDRDSATVSIII